MWTTLALMSALNWTPAQAGQLQLKNDRVTYGVLGQARKDSNFLPGDRVVLAFDIEGLEVKKGQVQYSMSMELTNAKGEQQYKRDPQVTMAVNTLGGSRLPAFALTEIGTDTKPGEYTMTVTVSDENSKPKAKQTLKHKFQVKPSQFGIVRAGFWTLTLNENGAGMPGQVAPPVAVPGQSLLLAFTVVGFELKDEKMDPNVTMSMEVQDESGKVVPQTKPITGQAKSIKDEFKKLRVIPFQLPMQLNRSGNFKVVVTAEDKHSGKKATETLNLTVVEVK